MQIIKMGCGIFVALAAPVVVWAQPMSTPIVDPPRQQMQTVVPNLEVGAYLMNVTGKTFAGDSFLDVAVTDNGTPVADGTTVSLLLAFIRLRHIDLERWPTGREPAQMNHRRQMRSAAVG